MSKNTIHIYLAYSSFLHFLNVFQCIKIVQQLFWRTRPVFAVIASQRTSTLLYAIIIFCFQHPALFYTHFCRIKCKKLEINIFMHVVSHLFGKILSKIQGLKLLASPFYTDLNIQISMYNDIYRHTQ